MAENIFGRKINQHGISRGPRFCFRFWLGLSGLLFLLAYPALAIAADSTFHPNRLPIVKEERKPRKVLTVVATAYNSLPEQTDSTPFITANGSTVHPGTLAANFLPFGAYVSFPELYGDRIFMVEDRMAQRYGYGRVDLWMEEYAEAREFGVKRLKMEVY